MSAIRIAVTGVGVICAVGRDRHEFWRNALDGRCGLEPLGLFEARGLPAKPVGEVRLDLLRELGNRPELRRASRTDLLCIRAAEEAVASAGLRREGGRAPLSDFGVSLGCSTAGMLDAEGWCDELATRGVTGRPIVEILRAPTSTPTDVVARRLGAGGPRLSNMTACASSALSIADAAELVRAGETPGMIAGGGDALCRMTYAGFHSLKLVDDRACRPFDASRRGLSLGEGAGILVLERWEDAVRRGARPLAEYVDHGSSCDAHHTTAPHPEGRGAEAAMRQALARAGLAPHSIDHIHAHGTGTQLNDLAEAHAIRKVFGDGGSCRVPVTAGKSMTGHLLGGCGAVAAATVVLSLCHGAVPPTCGWAAGDEATELDIVAGTARPVRGDYAMSNSFGFGGTNCSLIFRRAT